MKRMITQELINFVASLSESQLSEILNLISVDGDVLILPDDLLNFNLGGVMDADGNYVFPLEDNAGKVLAVAITSELRAN